MYLISSVFKSLLLCNVCKKKKSEIKKIEKKNKLGAALHFQKVVFTLCHRCHAGGR